MMLKILWEYFPKKLKKYLFPSTIILSVLSTLAYLFISDQIISLSIQALMQLLLVFAIYSIIVTIIGFFISYNRIIYFLYDIKKNNYSNEQHSAQQKIKVINKKEKIS